MKKLISVSILSILSLSLAGCFNFTDEGNTDSEQPTDSSMMTYQGTSFDIEIPNEWQIINRDEFTSEIPSDTLVIFRNNVKNETFTANVNIIKRALQSPESSLDFAKRTINRQSNGLSEYSESKKETIKAKIGDQTADTFLTYFTASKTTSDPKIQYIQTYATNGNSAFIVTGAFSPNEQQNTVQTIENIVKSFRLK